MPLRLVTIVILLFGALPLPAAEPIFREDFANGTGGWLALGPESAVRAVDGTLVLSYTVAAGSLRLAYLPMVGLPFAEFRSLRFQVSTDVPMPVAVILSEKKPGGGNYTAISRKIVLLLCRRITDTAAVSSSVLLKARNLPEGCMTAACSQLRRRSPRST